MNKELARQRDFAVDVAESAGRIMRGSFSSEVKKSRKDDNTLVTAADIEINRLVIHAIQREYPRHNVLAEEGSPSKTRSMYTWVCDPIDGTIAFANGIPTSVFSLALTKNGVPMLGVVHDPFQDKTYVAVLGEGSHLNGNKISVSKVANFDKAIIGSATWKGAQKDIRSHYERIIDKGAMVLMLGSLTYMGAKVASGELSACIHPARMPFDTAAVKIIIEEAGGLVTGLSGQQQRYDKPIDGAIMSNGLLHRKLIEITRE